MDAIKPNMIVMYAVFFRNDIWSLSDCIYIAN